MVILVLWLRFSKRASRRKLWSSDISEQPARQVSVKKGQLVRTSWNTSLTGPVFGLEETRQQNPRPFRQWPESTLSSEFFGDDQELCLRHSMQFNTQTLSFFDELPRRSWADSLSMQSSAGWRESEDILTDEEGLRRSYVFDWAVFTNELEKAHARPELLKIEPPSIDSPAPLSPITPLTLPRSPRNAASCPTSSPPLPQYPALPPRPVEVHRASRYREKLGSTRQRKQRSSTMLNPSLVSHHRTRPQLSGRRSSIASSPSFLQAWSDVYRDWLDLPKTLSSSRSAKKDPPASCHVDVVSLAETNLEAEEGYEADASLPSSKSTVLTDDRSLVSRTHFSATSSTIPNRKTRRSNLEETKQTRRDEISWLVDD